MNNSQDQASSVRQTILCSIEAPRLRGVSTKNFIDFKERRELYEKQISEKNKEPGTCITPLSLKASIDDADLRIFLAAGWIKASSIQEITETQIGESIVERCRREEGGENLNLINEAVSKVSMKMSILEAEDRVWSLYRDYLEALRRAGYDTIPESRPHIAIKHILDRLKPHYLKTRMTDIIIWRKNEQFDKKDFNAFMRIVAQQAKQLQQERGLVGIGLERDISSEDEIKRATIRGARDNPKKFKRFFKSNKNVTQIKSPDKHGKKRKAPEATMPPCLNKTCREKGGKHFIQNCPNSSDSEKIRLRDQYRANKKARSNSASTPSTGTINVIKNKITASKPSDNALFEASFLEGTLTSKLMADQGADTNLMPSGLLRQIKTNAPTTRVTTIEPPLVYSGITGDKVIHCSKEVTMDIYLKIRHGSSLLLRNVVWKIPEEPIPCLILGRPVLQSIGCDNKKMLQAACDRNDGDINVGKALQMEGIEDNLNGSIAALYGESMFHNRVSAEGDGIDDNLETAEFGLDSNQDIRKELEARVDEAITEGFPSNKKDQLLHLVLKHIDVFKIRLGNDGPARITPMKIRIDPKRQPIRVKARKYPIEQRKFMDTYFQKLVEYGYIEPNQNASWQSAPHLVPKDKTRYRVTIDLRPLNAATISEAWPMPNLEAELADFAGKTCFATMDFCNAYWQIPLDKDSRNACGIISPQGVFTSTRVLHGLKNATAHFQAHVPRCFQSMQQAFKSWLDDFIIYADEVNDLIKHLDEFFSTSRKYNLKLSAKKCKFFQKKVKWCGRIIDALGYQLDPKNIEAIRNMDYPTTADELCQFIHCCRWMSNCIPDFHRISQPLSEILEKAYASCGRRRKTALRKVALSKLSWGATHEASFSKLKEILKNAVKLAHLKENHTIAVFTDASDKFWAGIVTQTHQSQMKMEIEKQQHEPLAFLGGKFTQTQENWTTYEKEAFAIIKVFEKMDFVLWGPNPVRIYTDHRNLLYVFAPTALRPDAPRYVLAKVHRWAIHMSRFDFIIEHIQGVKNIFADLLTRWSRGHRTRKALCGRIMALYQSIVPGEMDVSDVETTEIRKAQEMHSPPKDATMSPCGLWKKGDRIWIPEKEDVIKMKILVKAHCGSSGHRGKDTTESIVRSEFYWTQLMEDVEDFVQNCLHCIIAKSGERIPRPLSTALHGQHPNEVVHMDFLYMGPAKDSKLKYVLILKDDLTSYTWLLPHSNPDTVAAVESIAKWIAAFGSMEWLVSDRGPHFKSTVMSMLTNELHIRHHFSTAYCPWANGTVERMCKEVIRTARALLSEWRLSNDQWPSVIHCIQAVINQAPLKRLGKTCDGKGWRCPTEALTGLKPRRFFTKPVPPVTVNNLKRISQEKAMSVARVDKLHETLEVMHKEVMDNNQKMRKKSQQTHNAKTNVIPFNFHIGDYVMMHPANARHGKLNTGWIGPMRIIDTKSDLVFVVEDLHRSRTFIVHAQRLTPYPAQPASASIHRKLLEHAEYLDSSMQLVNSLHDVRVNDGNYEIAVSWLGWNHPDDRTWEPVTNLKEDVPGMVIDFLHSSGKRNVKEKILDLYFK